MVANLCNFIFSFVLQFEGEKKVWESEIFLKLQNRQAQAGANGTKDLPEAVGVGLNVDRGRTSV